MGVSLEQLVQHLTETGLLSAADISSLQESLPPDKRPQNAETLALELVEAKKLTPYQAQAVSQGETKTLVFDEYVVLDKIGEGGMGVVLKAQHRRMKRNRGTRYWFSDFLGRPPSFGLWGPTVLQ